jgi:hypothetical protein
MAEPLITDSLKKLFRFPMQGPNWQSRFLVGTALLLAGCVIPIVPGLFVSGYLLLVMRRAIQGEEPELPAWQEWGQLIVDGLRATAVGLVYFLPALVVIIASFTAYFAGSFYFPLAASTAADPNEAFATMMLMLFGSMGVMFLGMFLGTLLSLLGAALLPVALAHFVAQDKVSAAFRLRQWWPVLWGNKLTYFIGWVLAGGLMMMLYLAGMMTYYTLVLCCLLPILAAPVGLYLGLVCAALFGRIYHESLPEPPAAAGPELPAGPEPPAEPEQAGA